VEVTRKQFLDHYLESIEGGTAALFVGAGMSKPGFKDWKELLRGIADDLGLEIDKETDLIALAQYHVNEWGGRAKINRALIEEFARDVKISPNHSLIAQLPIRTIWTTNYDHLIEDSFRTAGRSPDIKMTPENLVNSPPSRDVVIYKMHGDVQLPHDAVLTKGDYETYANTRKSFVLALQSDLIQKTFLFLGYSFSDPNIDYILSRIRDLLGQNKGDHYCIMRRAKSAGGTLEQKKKFAYDQRKLQLRINDLKNYGIHAVMIDDFPEITDILRSLNRLCYRKTILVSGHTDDFGPLGRERVERLAQALGNVGALRYHLVAVAGSSLAELATTEAVKAAYKTTGRLSFDNVSVEPRSPRDTPVSEVADTLVAKVGFVILLCEDYMLGQAPGSGARALFDATLRHGRFPIPIGATGLAAAQLWEELQADSAQYFSGLDVQAEIAVLGQPNCTDEQITRAAYGIIEKASRTG